MSIPDCISICAIACEFMQHTDNSHRQAHHKLNAQCAGVLTDIADVLTALSAQDDNHSLVKTKVMESVSDKIAAQQKLCIPLNKSMMLKWHTHNPDSCVKMNFKDAQFALDDAVAANNSCLQIKTNIKWIHFKPNFAANNINHLSSEPFVAAPETPTIPASQQLPVTPEHACHLCKRLSSPPGGRTDTQLDGGQQTQGTGSAIDPEICLLVFVTDTQKDINRV